MRILVTVAAFFLGVLGAGMGIFIGEAILQHSLYPIGGPGVVMTRVFLFLGGCFGVYLARTRDY